MNNSLTQCSCYDNNENNVVKLINNCYYLNNKLIRLLENLEEGSGENETVSSMVELILVETTLRASSVVE